MLLLSALRARLQNIENKGFDTKFDEINNSIKNLQSDYNSIQTQEQKDYSQDIATLKTGVEKNTKKIDNLLPIGSIIMWSGTTIPTNWALCNGANGTPDLRDRFVVGAGSSYSIGATGGVNTVTLTKDQMPEHKHLMWFNGNNANNPWGQAVNTYKSPTDRGILSTEMSLNYNSPVGKNEPHENRPPYYALAYIMKIK